MTVADNFCDEPGRALTANVVLWPRVQTVFVTRTAFEALTPAQRRILRRAGREAVDAVLVDARRKRRRRSAPSASGVARCS